VPGEEVKFVLSWIRPFLASPDDPSFVCNRNDGFVAGAVVPDPSRP